MIFWIILGVLVLIAVLIVEALFGDKYRRGEYDYQKRECIMTQSERKCFESLMRAVSNNYHVFPQVHLPSFLDHKVVGQNWNGAFRHIDEKSVDFVLCTKNDLRPVLAIELDDWSHQQPNRQERDREVARILRDAKLPLLRLKDNSETPETITQKINDLLSPKTT